MKVRCINNDKIGYVDIEYRAHLTTGTIYEARDLTDTHVSVLADDEQWHRYNITRFEVLGEEDKRSDR